MIGGRKSSRRTKAQLIDEISLLHREVASLKNRKSEKDSELLDIRQKYNTLLDQLPPKVLLSLHDGKDLAEASVPIPTQGIISDALTGAFSYLAYSIADQYFGLLLDDVDRTIRAVEVTPLVEAPDSVNGIINVQGQIVMVVNMRRKLKLRERDIDPSDQFILALTRERRVALIVDHVKCVIERPATDLIQSETFTAGQNTLKGVLKFPDGLILIHNLEEFLSLEEITEPNGAI